MDALTLGIGLQGQHNFSLDGAKALLDAQKAKAAQAIAAQKKADEEMSAAIKDATGLIDPNKYANAYRAPVSNALNTFIQDVYQMKKNGTSDFGLSFAKRYGEFRNQIGTYEVASKQYFDNRNNLHPEVIAIMDDPKGTERMADRGPLLGQEVNVTDKNDVILNPVPYNDPFQGLIADLQKERPELMPVEGQKPVIEVVPGTNKVISRVGTAITPADKEALINRYTALMLDPQTAPNAMISLYGEVNPDMMEDFQGGGVMPKAEVKNAIRTRVNQIIDEHPAFRGERKEEGTKPAPREAKESGIRSKVAINAERYTEGGKNEIRVKFGKTSAGGGSMNEVDLDLDPATMKMQNAKGDIVDIKGAGTIKARAHGIYYDKKSGTLYGVYSTQAESTGTTLKMGGMIPAGNHVLVDFKKSGMGSFATSLGTNAEDLMETLDDKLKSTASEDIYQDFMEGLTKSIGTVSSPSAAPKKTGAAGL